MFFHLNKVFKYSLIFFTGKPIIVSLSPFISENNDFTKIKKDINVRFSNQIRSERIKIEEIREYHGYWSINNRNYIWLSNDEISPFLKDFFTVSGLENKKIKKFNSNYNSIQDNYYNIPLIIHSSIESTDLIKEYIFF